MGQGLGSPLGGTLVLCATLLGWSLTLFRLGDVFATEKPQQTQTPTKPKPQTTLPVSQGSRVRSHTTFGGRKSQEGFGEAQRSAGSVEHRMGDEKSSWYRGVGVSLAFDAVLNVTVPPTRDLAQ